jgi:hypothetical protein
MSLDHQRIPFPKADYRSRLMDRPFARRHPRCAVACLHFHVLILECLEAPNGLHNFAVAEVLLTVSDVPRMFVECR